MTYVSFLDPGKNSTVNSAISCNPILMIEALVLLPNFNPSTNPAARATTFFSAPARETPETSCTVDTLNRLVWKTADQRAHSSAVLAPTVVSQNCSLATSCATLGPPRAAQGVPIFSSIRVANVLMSAPLTSTPLMAEIEMAPGVMTPSVWNSSRTVDKLEQGVNKISRSQLMLHFLSCRPFTRTDSQLMRGDHDKHSSILDDLLQVAHSDQVARELDVGEVTVVHVRRVDDLCELLAVDLCGGKVET